LTNTSVYVVWQLAIKWQFSPELGVIYVKYST